jgi:hypothetical protein
MVGKSLGQEAAESLKRGKTPYSRGNLSADQLTRAHVNEVLEFLSWFVHYDSGVNVVDRRGEERCKKVARQPTESPANY